MKTLAALLFLIATNVWASPVNEVSGASAIQESGSPKTWEYSVNEVSGTFAVADHNLEMQAEEEGRGLASVEEDTLLHVNEITGSFQD